MNITSDGRTPGRSIYAYAERCICIAFKNTPVQKVTTAQQLRFLGRIAELVSDSGLLLHTE